MIMILWMEEILHQLIDGLSDYPIIYRVSTIQGGAGFRNHPQYHDHVSVESLLKNRRASTIDLQLLLLEISSASVIALRSSGV